MCPPFTINKPGYGTLVYSIKFGYRFLTYSISNALFDCYNLAFGQNGLAMVFSNWTSKQRILFGLIHIILVIAQVQMINETTGLVVAPVKNHHPIWNVAVENNPSEPVSGVFLALKLNQSVSGWHNELVPNKASCFWNEVGKKPWLGVFPSISKLSVKSAPDCKAAFDSSLIAASSIYDVIHMSTVSNLNLSSNRKGGNFA